MTREEEAVIIAAAELVAVFSQNAVAVALLTEEREALSALRLALAVNNPKK